MKTDSWPIRMATMARKLSEALVQDRRPQELAAIMVEAARIRPDISAGVLMPNPGTETLQLLSVAGPLQERIAALNFSVDNSIAGWALRTGEHTFSPHLRRDARPRPIGSDLDVSLAAMVLTSGPKRWGVLCVVYPNVVENWSEEFDALKAMADVISLGLELYEARLAGEQHVRHMQALNEVSRLLASTSIDLGVLLSLIVDVATGLFNLDICALLRQSDDQLGVAAARGLDPNVVNSLSLPSDSVPPPASFCPGAPERVLSLRLTGRMEPQGYLVVSRRHPFTDKEQDLLGTWASLAGVALENQRLITELETTHFEMISQLISLLEGHHNIPPGHSRRVADLAVATARRLNLSDRDARDLALASLVHHFHHLLELGRRSP